MAAPLTGKHALITGIGAAIARRLADAALWLCTRAAQAIAGQTISVSGGEV